MTDRLPPHLRRLFEPRPPIKYLKPLDRHPSQRRGPTVSGIGDLVHLLKDYDPDYVPRETLEERRKRMKEEKQALHEARLKEALEKWDPHNDPHASGDPYKTLFVGRLSYSATEDDLRRVFERYGKIAKIHLVTKKGTDQSRGYAFIEYEDERDMKAAYRDADGMKILDRRIVVDVERGRTVKGWKPKRLGGGLGQTRVGGPDQNQKYSGRDPTIGGGYQPSEERGYGGYHGYGRSHGGRGDYGARLSGSHGRDYRDRGYSDRYRTRSRSPRRDYRERDRDYERSRERNYDSRDRGRDRDRTRERDRDYRDHSRHRY